jgi:hypothetical protein
MNVSVEPTATQSDALEHETAPSAVSAGLGVSTYRHAPPRHCSENVPPWSALVEPTAMHADGPLQETPNSPAEPSLAGNGTGVSFQT